MSHFLGIRCLDSSNDPVATDSPMPVGELSIVLRREIPVVFSVREENKVVRGSVPFSDSELTGVFRRRHETSLSSGQPFRNRGDHLRNSLRALRVVPLNVWVSAEPRHLPARISPRERLSLFNRLFFRHPPCQE